MSDIQNLKKVKTFEEEEQINLEEIKGYAFLDEAECIANQIIEKIISLAITDSIKNKIEKLIPEYCFAELKQTLEIVANLDFLTHDKDDLNKKKKIPHDKIKSATKRKKEDSIFIKENAELQKSEIIRKYKYKRDLLVNNSLDDCSLDLDVFNLTENEFKEKEKEKRNKKIVMGILVREDFNDKMTSFQKQEKKKQKSIDRHNQIYNFPDDKDKVFKEVYDNEKEPFKINPEEKIDTIKNVEIHKIEISPPNQINNKISNIDIPFDSIIDSTNFWKTLSQPLTAPIDREAGTKIKYEKPVLQNKVVVINTIDEHNDDLEELNDSHKKHKNENPKKKLKINFLQKRNENTEKNKKKKYIQIDFESTDLDPKVYESKYETTETTELRMEVEKELQEKRKEMEKLAQKEKERLAKEEEVAELRKKLEKKNVTVDIKGELVFIKPLDLQALTQEFNKGRVNYKNIKIIEKEPKNSNVKPSLVVEKNPEINDDTKDSKAASKKTKKKNLLGGKINNIFSHATKKILQKQLIDKNIIKQIAGSNFSIINPEVGVNIKEERKMKSGGKDFYKKYNRFSVEVFQDQLNKTISSNFFPKISEQTPSNIKIKKKTSLSLKQNKIEEEKSKTIIPPNEKNNTLSLKTKNLKYALENLDLITEGEERDLKSKKLFKKNLIKKKKYKNDKRKIDFDEMNIFAKTLMGSHNWGRVLYNDSKKDFKCKMPTKPEENELQRELPINILKHMPRKRLPPIGTLFKINKMEQTISGFYSQRKPTKFKLRIGENKNSTQTEKDEI
jgi:hypothetical protein